MKGIFKILIIGFVMMMAVNALTPGDVVREAKEPAKPVLSIQGTSASVFQTEPFAKDKKRMSPFANDSKEKNFLTSPAEESVLSENAAKEFADSVPVQAGSMKETFRRNNTTVAILGPVPEEINPVLNVSNTSMDVITFLNS